MNIVLYYVYKHMTIESNAYRQSSNGGWVSTSGHHERKIPRIHGGSYYQLSKKGADEWSILNIKTRAVL